MNSFTLISPRVRDNALEAVRSAPPNWIVTIKEPKRSTDQNAKFHAICGDIASSGMRWAGKERSLEDWKALLVSAHSVATGSGGDVLPGIEGEFVAIRESTSRMSKSRASSLIEYTIAFCDHNGVQLPTLDKSGFR